jgi:hypothetical protein
MSIALKGGFQTQDRRLDRLPQFDERSRGFAAIDAIDTRTPRSYAWSCQKWLDQGVEGACVGYSLGHELACYPIKEVGVTNEYARQRLYWRAQQIDPWEGGSYPGATPYYEGTSVLAGLKAAQELGHFAEYRWAFGLNDLILAVGYSGPAVLGINWYEGMFDPDDRGFIHPTGQVMGGHAILCTSVSLYFKRFRLHNSWGIEWGRNGTCYVSFDDMAKLLAEGGEAALPRLRKYVGVTG